MAKITKVKETKRGKLAVFLDGSFWESFDPGFARDKGLDEGRELSQLELAKIESELKYLRAYERALIFLSYRPRSVREVKKKLIEAGYSDGESENAISRLTAAGYLDDVKFARDWITSRASGKYYGSRRLKSELVARGVASDIVDEQLAEVCSDSEEERRAFEAAKIKLQKMAVADKDATKRRLIAYLLRRGYNSAIALRVSKALLDSPSEANE